jgi:hypothetical protein
MFSLVAISLALGASPDLRDPAAAPSEKVRLRQRFSGIYFFLTRILKTALMETFRILLLKASNIALHESRYFL